MGVAAGRRVDAGRRGLSRHRDEFRALPRRGPAPGRIGSPPGCALARGFIGRAEGPPQRRALPHIALDRTLELLARERTAYGRARAQRPPQRENPALLRTNYADFEDALGLNC
jgi:hypothetical protein